MKWFRMYAEVLNDPKVQILDGETFKFWVNCLCVASQNEGELYGSEHLAFAMRKTPESTTEALDKLVKGGLLAKHSNQHGQKYYVHGWEKRQYKSDTSTDRVKRL